MQHPDEGTIHGWLDGALTPEEAIATEAHVASCAECAAVVPEARGIRAAATRILSALEEVPAGGIPTPDYFADVRAAEAASAASRSARRRVWAHPGVRAAAALIVVGGLSWAVLRGGAGERDQSLPVVAAERAAAETAATLKATIPSESTTAANVASAVPQPARDAALRDVATREVRPRAQAVSPAPGRPTQAPRTQSSPTPARRARDLEAETVADRDARQYAAEEQSRVDSAMRRESVATAAPPLVARSSASAAGATTGALAQASVAAAPSEAPVPRIVIDRGYVDSVLAADSLETADTYLAGGRAPAAAARIAAPQSDRVARSEARSEARPSGSPTTLRAQGCWLLETSPWSPRYRATDTLRLLPRRVELMLDRGIADEAGERLVRPAPGEPTLPIGTTGIWRVIATNQVRLTIATRDGWTTVTLTVGDDSLSGTARAYSDVDRLLRRATVSARRVVCRTEP